MGWPEKPEIHELGTSLKMSINCINPADMTIFPEILILQGFHNDHLQGEQQGQSMLSYKESGEFCPE